MMHFDFSNPPAGSVKRNIIKKIGEQRVYIGYIWSIPNSPDVAWQTNIPDLKLQHRGVCDMESALKKIKFHYSDSKEYVNKRKSVYFDKDNTHPVINEPRFVEVIRPQYELADIAQLDAEQPWV